MLSSPSLLSLLAALHSTTAAPLVAGTISASLTNDYHNGTILGRRALPTFHHFPVDSPQPADIQAAIREAVVLAQTVLQHSDREDILDLYFDKRDKQKVLQVYKNIIGDNHDGTGAAAIGHINVISSTARHRDGTKIQCEGSEAYVTPWEKPGGQEIELVFCPVAFTKPLLMQTNPHDRCPYLHDIVMSSMESLSSTALHELTHVDSIGAAGLGHGKPVIDVQRKYGSPKSCYGPGNTHKLRQKKPQLALTNADSYAWYALHVFWTVTCGRDFKPNPAYHHGKCPLI